MRATAAEDRTARILASTLDLFVELPINEMTLAVVAERSGVGLQTVIRRFGSKEGLITAAIHEIAARIEADLPDLEKPAPTPEQVVNTLNDQYEVWHRHTAAMLSQQSVSPALTELVETGRRYHSERIATAFADPIDALPKGVRDEALAQLVASTSFQVWSWLNQHQGLSSTKTRKVMLHMVRGALRQ